MAEQLNLTLHKWYQRRDGKIMKCTQVFGNVYYMIGGNMYPKYQHLSLKRRDSNDTIKRTTKGYLHEHSQWTPN